MKKKVLSVLLVAAMAMSMLTGCGSKPAGNDVQSAAPSETSKKQRQQQKRLFPQKTRH